MSKLFKVVLFALTAFLLSACGGGGGGGGGAVTLYPFQEAFIQSLETTSTRNFTVSGTESSFPVNGSGTLVDVALFPGTFLGAECLQQVSTITGNVVVNNQVFSLDQTNVSYYDDNFNYLGQIGNDFLIVASPTNLPDEVQVGDSGVLYSGATFTDDTFMTQDGYQSATFSINLDSIPNSALYALTITDYDLNGNAVSTTTNLFHLFTDGTSTPISSTDAFDTGTVTATFH